MDNRNDDREPVLLGHGFWFEDLAEGFRFRTMGRTITETDLVTFVNLIWFTEEVFVNTHDTHGRALRGRVVPGALVFTFAEGLVMPSMQFTGLAFLQTEVDIHKPTQVGDTIYVRGEVIERRLASAGSRGLVRTRNEVVNQHGELVLTYNPLRLVKCRAHDTVPADAAGVRGSD
ncbi:MAG: MaoC family dehydratase N-terminal domain-containing protein [Burkholderiales bacterium]|nr:MaoC family dehydratase N-terminal domain-containing protein [Burkholderiales bacterium]